MYKRVKVYNSQGVVLDKQIGLRLRLDARLEGDVLRFYEDFNIHKMCKAYKLQPGDWVEFSYEEDV